MWWDCFDQLKNQTAIQMSIFGWLSKPYKNIQRYSQLNIAIKYFTKSSG